MQYKFLPADLKAYDYRYVVGEWTPPIPEPILCKQGYHTCDKSHLLEWCSSGSVLFEVETTGASDGLDGHGKTAWESIKLVRQIEGWNERTARLFAVWCAREAMKLIADPDPRSIAACDLAERYANGEATIEELVAADAAAHAAARAAADAAAHAAAYVAAHAAAYVVAHAAARAAQSTKLLEMIGEL